MILTLLIWLIIAAFVLFLTRWILGTLNLGSGGQLIYVAVVVVLVIGFFVQTGLLSRL